MFRSRNASSHDSNQPKSHHDSGHTGCTKARRQPVPPLIFGLLFHTAVCSSLCSFASAVSLFLFALVAVLYFLDLLLAWLYTRRFALPLFDLA